MWFYLALLSAIFNAIGNIARRTHGSLADPAELAWWMMLLSLPLSFGLMLTSGTPHYTDNDFILPAILVSVLNTFACISQFKAYKYGDASIVSPIANFLPIFLLGTSFLILGVLPSMAGLVGILFVVAGVYYSSVSGKHKLMHPFRQLAKNRGSRAMLLTVTLWSISTVFEKVALQSASPAFLLVLQACMMLTMLSVYLLARPQKGRLKRGEKVLKRWGWHIAAISVFATLAVYFQLLAVNLVDPSYVLAVKRLDVVITILLAGVFLHEKHVLKRFQGSLLALAGVAIIYISR